jgi:small subunit ribosomal protein S3
MGQKCHPVGLRLGIIKDWQSRWYATPRAYANQVVEDQRIRNHIVKKFARDQSAGRGRNVPREVGLSRVEIERAANTLRLTLHTAKPGLIIGRGGRGVDELRAEIEALTDRRVHITVQEVREPGLDAQLVAENIASQIERRVSFKRAVRQAVQRTMREGAKGIRVIVSGRLAGAEIARSYRDHDGKIPLQTLRADIDFGLAEARTTYGNVGVRVWTYRGDVLPEAVPKVPKLEPLPAAPPREHKAWRRVGVVRPARAEEEAGKARAGEEQIAEAEVQAAEQEKLQVAEVQPEAAAEAAQDSLEERAEEVSRIAVASEEDEEAVGSVGDTTAEEPSEESPEER